MDWAPMRWGGWDIRRGLLIHSQVGNVVTSIDSNGDDWRMIGIDHTVFMDFVYIPTVADRMSYPN